MNTPISQHTSDFAGLTDWFPVFRTGEQIDSKGRKRTFTEADLDSIVSNHTADEPAPLVVGHPKTNDPAYGWTGALKREGDTLFAKAKDVVTEFEEAVRKRMYRNRSISIVPEGEGWKLRHIGFLGAKPPAVAGLGDIQFAGDDQNALEFALDEARLARRTGWGLESVARVLRGVREFLIDKFDLETADRVVPSYSIDSIAEHGSATAALADHSHSFSEPEDDTGDIAVPGEKQFTQADIDTAVQSALDAERQAQAKKDSALRFAQRKAEAETLIEQLVADGKLLPAQKEGLAEFMASLPDADDAAFEFAVADNATAKKTPAQFMADFMARLGKQVELGENRSPGPDGDRANPTQDYHGHQVNPERAALDAKARDYMRKHNVDYITAVVAVEEQ